MINVGDLFGRHDSATRTHAERTNIRPTLRERVHEAFYPKQKGPSVTLQSTGEPWQLSRRSLLLSAAAAACLAGADLADATPAFAAPMPFVPALPSGAPVRSQFSPPEQLYSRFLPIAAPMANDINDSDTTDRGFMAGNWWRTPNAAYNARVQEHVATLSWFYGNNRSWNPYYLNGALRGRLDAAIGHYLALQQTDGSWPEYSRTEHSLAATAFGVGYLAKTLKNLRDSADPFFYNRRSQLNDALKRAMDFLLEPSRSFWGNGGPTAWANQICAGLAGAAVALQLTPDAALQARLDERMAYFAGHGQSPAGFFYEFNGMDTAYSHEVQMPELAEIYVRSQSPHAVQMAQRWADWFGYVMIREPGSYGFVAYTAASCRTELRYYDEVSPEPDESAFGGRLIPAVPKLAAFYTAREDRAAARSAWAAEPGPAPALPKGGITQPREMQLISYGEYLPTRAEKNAAIATLPYLSSTDWAEIRRDSGVTQDYVFVRRPRYYFGAFFGTRPTGEVSSGAGFLWHPLAGILVHSGHGSGFAWGTTAPNGPDTQTSLAATYTIGGTAWNGTRRDGLGATPVLIQHRRYDGTTPTHLTLGVDRVTRSVNAGGPATEQIPLVLRPSDTVTFGNGVTAPHNTTASANTTSLTVRRGAVTMTITWSQQATVTLSGTGRTFFANQLRRTHILRIPHGGQLVTNIVIS